MFSQLSTSPYILLFVTIAAGLLVGRVKLGKLRLGSSGALFVGLLVGYLVVKADRSIWEASGGKIVDGNIFTMALIFFVASVGLLAAKDVATVLKKYGPRFVILGLLVTMVGAGGSYLASGIIDGASVYSMSGVYTGALTSSPGLASAIEAAEKESLVRVENFTQLSEKEKQQVWEITGLNSEQARERTVAQAVLTAEERELYLVNANGQVGMGYAIAYPFGVIVVILAVNLLPVFFHINVAQELKQYNAEMAADAAGAGAEDGFDIVGLAVVFAAGYGLGSIKFPLGFLGEVSLEVTGGVLIAALVLGHIGKLGGISFRMNEKVLDIIREISVVFFLAIVGLNYGYSAVSALLEKGLVTAVMSFIIAIAAVMSGFLVGRYMFKLNWIVLAGALCGGMTSTPGLGAAIEATDSEGPAGGYGATYPFALLGMILFTIIMYQLPAF